MPITKTFKKVSQPLINVIILLKNTFITHLFISIIVHFNANAVKVFAKMHFKKTPYFSFFQIIMRKKTKKLTTKCHKTHCSEYNFYTSSRFFNKLSTNIAFSSGDKSLIWSAIGLSLLD